MNHILKLLFILSILIVILFYLISMTGHEKMADPSIYMDNNLTPSQKIMLKIHAQHHSAEELNHIKDLMVNENKTWEEAHKVLKPKPFYHHFKHIDVEMKSLFLKSLTLAVGVLFATISKDILAILLKNEKNNYNIISISILFFFIVLFLFSTVAMVLKHQLSFQTFNETLFY